MPYVSRSKNLNLYWNNFDWTTSRSYSVIGKLDKSEDVKIEKSWTEWT